MDGPIVLYIVLGLVAILFIVCSVFSGKTWRVVHILLISAVFLASVILIFLCAAIFKTHDEFRTKYHAFEKRLDETRTNTALMSDGYAQKADGTIERQEDSIRSYSAELRRVLYDRGRVWPNTVAAEFGENSVTLDLTRWGDETFIPAPENEGQLPGAEVAAAEGAAQPPARTHGIEAKMVLYAFLEEPLSVLEDQHRAALLANGKTDLAGLEPVVKVPSVYLGEFVVQEATPATVILVPTVPPSDGQKEVMQSSSWVLYELMPTDTPEVFASLDEAQLRSLIPEETADSFLRDGKPGDPETDPPERLWFKVKFMADSPTIPVDAPGDPPNTPIRDFDNLGQANPIWLRRGEQGDGPGKVIFKNGQEAVFDPETAELFIDQEICEELDRIYVRELRDYDYLFDTIHARTRKIMDSSITIQLDTNVLVEEGGAIALAKENVAYREQEVKKLSSDLSQFQHERDEMTEFFDSLEKEYARVNESLTKIYQTNLALAAELASISQQLEDSINERTRAAAQTELTGP